MESHSEYMLRRGGEEQDAAERAASPKARAVHIELAARYRDAAGRPPPPPHSDGSALSCRADEFRILESGG